MKKHPAIGARILASYSQFSEGAGIVLAHQEARFGYPEVTIGFVPAIVMLGVVLIPL